MSKSATHGGEKRIVKKDRFNHTKNEESGMFSNIERMKKNSAYHLVGLKPAFLKCGLE
jgi:hypothetical protein